MAGRRGGRKAGTGVTVAPILLALVAVAAVFGFALLVASLRDSAPTAPNTPAAVAVAVPAAPVAAVPAPPRVAPAPPPTAPDNPAPAEPVVEAPPPVRAAPAPPPLPPSVLPEPVVLRPPAVLPVPIPGGVPAWRRHAVPAPAIDGRPAIAIIIDDMGVDVKRSDRAAALPGPLTLAWLPYATDLPRRAAAARSAGHELLVHLPMEPGGPADPGPGALLVSLRPDEIVQRLDRALAAFGGYVGVNNHMGSRFTANRAGMAPVLAELHRRGLLWLDSRTTPDTVGPDIARGLGMPSAGRDVFLDNTRTVEAVQAQLARTEAIARSTGTAIAIGHPHDATLAALAGWIPEMRRRGFVLVPLSAVVRARCACE
ncbi:divergent polysaccharide deacetylase family protein [Azospirillum halopraeferens]|uniref:divergent polysaccharide deacetylase family protein n=1 Tax=Azospirillum halopraeferens TaxID=34010 RepID=UPI0003F61CEB|nr:divergent polysaccharide deacetylase family protein [Azospirillum halopraeferens]